MVITWYGQACFKIQSGDTVVAIDPFGKEIGLTSPRFRADVALVTHAHPDHANTNSLGGGPFIISGPGEYEVKGVNVIGIETFHDSSSGAMRGKNTLYVIDMEEIRLLHMGDFGESELRTETLDAVGDVDIVMIPVGGTYTIDGKAAAKIVRQIEPAYAIPIHFRIPGLALALEPADAFLKEMGAAGNSPQEKLVIRRKDIVPGKKTEIIILKTS